MVKRPDHLEHVNKDNRSNYDLLDVKILIESAISDKNFLPSDTQAYGTEFCSYFVVHADHMNAQHKIVFCICSDKPNTIGVITAHKTS